MAKICSESAIFIFLFFSVDAVKRKLFSRVFYIHALIVPCLVYFLETGYVPLWLGVSTIVVEILVVLLMKYVTRKDLIILAKN